MNTLNDFWIPKTGEELERLANILTTNAREAHDLIKAHAWFGHHFGNHLGKVQANVSVIQGKPALLSDALVGICYAKGLVRRFQVVSSDDHQCTVEAERVDEPAGTIHSFTFTIEMAQQMNLVKASWHKQRANMLKKRARAWLVREVFSEAVSGLYTIDEMADHSNLSDREVEELTARSFGYDDGLSRSNQPQSVPPVQPTPAPAPISYEPIEIDEPKVAADPLYTFDTTADFWHAVESEDINRHEVDTKLKSLEIDIDSLSAEDREELYYSTIRHNVIRRSSFLPAEWQTVSAERLADLHGGLSHQYPIVKDIPIGWLKYRLSAPAFVETISIAIDADADKVKTALQKYDPNDWALYEYVDELTR